MKWGNKMVTSVLERIGVLITVEHDDRTVPYLGALRNYRVIAVAAREPDAWVSFGSGAARSSVNANHISVTLPSADFTQRGFQVAVDQAFALGLERQGRHVIHASAIASDEGVLVLWGQSGAGKTTLARDIRSRHGGSVISNGALVLGLSDEDILAFGASKKLAKIRVSSDQPGVHASSSPAYETKHEVNIAEWGAESVHLPLRVVAFNVVRAVRGLERAYFAPIDVPRMIPKLYQEMSRSILGTEALIFGRSGQPIVAFPSLSTPDGHRQRWELASRLLAIGAHATGPMEALSDSLWSGFQRALVTS